MCCVTSTEACPCWTPCKGYAASEGIACDDALPDCCTTAPSKGGWGGLSLSLSTSEVNGSCEEGSMLGRLPGVVDGIGSMPDGSEQGDGGTALPGSGSGCNEVCPCESPSDWSALCRIPVVGKVGTEGSTSSSSWSSGGATSLSPGLFGGGGGGESVLPLGGPEDGLLRRRRDGGGGGAGEVLLVTGASERAGRGFVGVDFFSWFVDVCSGESGGGRGLSGRSRPTVSMSKLAPYF
mmetsp:Transcript_5655/g.12277  ORF Transcript_5655/g.12277 Transcript_5655/m.12277 type:complete len:236 (-) Transcript_5655:12-719(-)